MMNDVWWRCFAWGREKSWKSKQCEWRQRSWIGHTKFEEMGHFDRLKLSTVLEGYDGKHSFKSYWEGLIEDFRWQADSIKVWNYCKPEEQEIAYDSYAGWFLHMTITSLLGLFTI